MSCVEFGNDGLTIIFDTNRGSRKFKNIQHNPKVSLVIGWEDEQTAQYEGVVTLLEAGPELEHLKQAYFKKALKPKSGRIPKAMFTSRLSRSGCALRT